MLNLPSQTDSPSVGNESSFVGSKTLCVLTASVYAEPPFSY